MKKPINHLLVRNDQGFNSHLSALTSKPENDQGFNIVDASHVVKPKLPSQGLYIRQFGRALRKTDGETRAIIIDDPVKSENRSSARTKLFKSALGRAVLNSSYGKFGSFSSEITSEDKLGSEYIDHLSRPGSVYESWKMHGTYYNSLDEAKHRAEELIRAEPQPTAEEWNEAIQMNEQYSSNKRLLQKYRIDNKYYSATQLLDIGWTTEQIHALPKFSEHPVATIKEWSEVEVINKNNSVPTFQSLEIDTGRRVEGYYYMENGYFMVNNKPDTNRPVKRHYIVDLDGQHVEISPHYLEECPF